MSDPTIPPAAARCEPAKPRRTKQLADCPAPHGACSHPDICQSHGCAALERRGNIARAEAKQREAATHAAALRVVEAARGVEGMTDRMDKALREALAAFDAAQGGNHG